MGQVDGIIAPKTCIIGIVAAELASLKQTYNKAAESFAVGKNYTKIVLSRITSQLRGKDDNKFLTGLDDVAPRSSLLARCLPQHLLVPPQ